MGLQTVDQVLQVFAGSDRLDGHDTRGNLKPRAERIFLAPKFGQSEHERQE